MLTTLYGSLRGQSEGLKSLILLTAPLDFTDKEQISLARMTEERYFDVDRVLQAFGNMPAGLIDYGAKMLKPVENFVGGYMRLFDNLDNPKVVESWHAMNTWVNDAIPLAGGAYRQFIVDFYRGNKLINGTLTIRGERKFNNEVHEDSYLRVERAYGAFTRSFSLPNTVNTEAIKAEYKNGVLTVNMPKREETKPKQVKHVRLVRRPRLMPGEGEGSAREGEGSAREEAAVTAASRR